MGGRVWILFQLRSSTCFNDTEILEGHYPDNLQPCGLVLRLVVAVRVSSTRSFQQVKTHISCNELETRTATPYVLDRDLGVS
jgi:hypothetical protein